MENYTPNKWKWEKKAEVDILICNKVDLTPKLVRRDRVGHCILIKEIIQQEDTMIINIHVLNVGAPNFMNTTHKH
jgi:ribosome biogenesis GTPase A